MVDANDGPSNLREGRRLIDLGMYAEASSYLWRAVLLQTKQQGQGGVHHSPLAVSYYSADDAFLPFLQCYVALGRVVDGLVFVSVEGYLRGQDDVGDMYLGEALRRTGGGARGDDDGRRGDSSDGGDAVSRLKRLVDSDEWRASGAVASGGEAAMMPPSSWRYPPLREIRDSVDASNNARRRRGGGVDARRANDEVGDFGAEFDDKKRGRIESSTTTTTTTTTTSQEADLASSSASGTMMSPEELYDAATRLFNDDDRIEAGKLYELSCALSNRRLYPACTNAAYIRTTVCDWGYRGYGYEEDMRTIAEVTISEAEAYRSEVGYRIGGDLVVVGGDEAAVRKTYSPVVNNNGGIVGISELKRLKGMGWCKKKTKMMATAGSIMYEEDPNEHMQSLEFTHWARPTSVHPHMMLGYLLPHGGEDDDEDGNNDAGAMMLKRLVAESVADVDETRARIVGTGTGIAIKPLPSNLPYKVDEELHAKFVKRHRGEGTTSPPPPIKVGFVACSFNSKAVLYLSHDMFRFFDPSVVEVHVFSTGKPDSPAFIRGVMRGVDWRQRVIDSVDYFHDVRRFMGDHIGLARYIREEWEMEVLIDWDGYARQGERAMGLMALRPAPIQILHQEFLMTSGAQYFDYIVTDMVTSPPRLESLYAEKFIYLPNHFFSKGHAVQREVRPPTMEYAPRQNGTTSFRIGVGSPQENACQSTDPLGGANNNEVSFVYCNFNKFLKNNPETMRSWIRILRDVPKAILCLLEYPREGAQNLRRFVSEESTAPSVENERAGGSNVPDDALPDVNDRMHFVQWEWNPFDHQARTHSLCNAMLDSHPYNGHTTAQDAYFAGVPIVTRSDGDEMSSRVTTSANVVLGLEELNAYDGAREYERIAVRLGTDEAWFESMRARLVDTCLRKNPMHEYWDTPRYVRNFETGLKMAWDNYLDGKDIDHVIVREDGADGLRGTMEDELFAREERRRKMERRHLIDEL